MEEEEESTRLVDYFVIAGYNHEIKVRSGTASSKNGGGHQGNFSCQGTILQRFPLKDWSDCPFIDGLEHFCQPNGWKLSTDRSEPKFFISVLTDMEGDRHYCACLSFSEAVPKDLIEDAQKKVNGHDEDDEEVIDLRSNTTSLPRHIVPGISLPNMAHDTVLFAPKCLVLVSRHDFPEVFRNCLGVMYTVYSECLVGAGGERIKLETLVGNLLGHVYVPKLSSGNQIRFSLGGLDKLTINPPMYNLIPQTGVKVALLFRQLGIRNVLWLVMAALTEQKILFHSESFARLTDSCTALTALLYPLRYSHVFIPILPTSLIEVLSTPTPFIMGVHSIHDRELSEVMDTIVVDLDGGAISLPENYTIYKVENNLFMKTQQELAMVLKPDLILADNAFIRSDSSSKKPLSLLDKELRAVMLRMMVYILEGYRSCLTIVRIHPKPFITFHKAAFLGLRNQCDCEFTKRLLNCMFFNTFVSERGPPWRSCDLFDELYDNLGEQKALEEADPSKVLRHVQSLAEEFYRNENSTLNGGDSRNNCQKIPQPSEGAMSRIHQPIFPTLNTDLVEEIVKAGLEIHLKEVKAFATNGDFVRMRNKLVPMGRSGQFLEDSRLTKLPNTARRLEVLRNCIASIFENKIADAKKTFPAVLSALKSRQARLAFCDELALHKTGNSQVIVEHQQFDMIVRLMNAALQDDSDIDEFGIAATLLPLSTVFGRRLTKGVIQFVYTLIQDHAVWQNQQFWEATFFNDVQKGIKSLYIAMNDNNNPVTKISVLELAAEEMRKWRALEDPQQKERITAEEQTVYSQVFDYTNRMICLLCPMELNPKSIKSKRGFGDEYEAAASNSISNSMAESDSIDAESGFEDQEIPDRGQNVIKFVMRFADKVCSESSVTEDHIKAINQMIPSSVAMHLENLEAVVTQAKRLPPIQKPKINIPALLPGEELITENGLRVYLLDDGRDKANNGGLALLPAEGALFLTTYRIIFKGSPIDPFASEHTVIRHFPVASLTREKRYTLNEYLSEIEQQLKEGIQLRSNTFQLIRAAFDDEVSMEDVENFRKNVQNIRYPDNIFHFYAFRGGHQFFLNQENLANKAKEKAKYNTIRGLASRTLKNVSRATGIKTKTSARKQSSKYLFPNVMPAHGRLSMIETHDHKIYEEDEDNEVRTTNTLASIVQTVASTSKTLERMMERTYFKDWIRLGLISADYNLVGNKGQTYSSVNQTESFRVTTVNYRYSVASTYPALLLVPSKITDESLKRYARLHRQSRFPSITWKHPKNQALLLRGSSFHGKGFMGMIRRHQDNSQAAVAHTEMANTVEAELYITSIIQNTPRAMIRPESAWNMAGSELSLHSLVAPSEYPPAHSYPTLTPTMGRKANNAISRAMDTLTRNTPAPSFAPKRTRLSLSNMKGNRQMGSQSSLASSNLRRSGGGYSESDYYSGSDSSFLQRASLYIFGDKSQMKGVKLESHPKAEFIPIEFPEPKRIRASFKKLMRACVPSAVSAQPEQSFLKMVEGSEWLHLLQSLMQLSGAVVDLLDIQAASMMLCLEDGWDVTAQVCSVAQLCLDPYYRTIEGFRVLIEKEWLSLGHRFNHRSNLNNPNQDSGFTPVFLQFLDAVHQILAQFPMAFEFNQYYLRFLAYHHVSCRFHTFLCDNENQRSQAGLLSDSKTNKNKNNVDNHSSDDELGSTPTKSNMMGGIHPGLNVFDYIDRLHSKAPVFFNFMYSPDLQQTVLRPFSNISDLKVWDYYLSEELKHGPSYDYELILLEQEEDMSASVVDSSLVSNDRENLMAGYDCISRNDLNSCTALLEEIANLEHDLGHLPRSWQTHWQRVEVPPPVPPRESAISGIVQTTPSLYARQHSRTMHKKSTMELILKSKMGSSGFPGMTSASNLDVDPASGTVYSHAHKFEKINYTTPGSCDVCHSLLWGPRNGLRCSDCGYNVHEKCREKAPKTCTKFKTALPKDSTADDFERLGLMRGGGHVEMGKSRTDLDDAENVFYPGSDRYDTSQIIYKGYLYKQANFKIKGWKQRWFELDSTKHQLRYYDTREDFHCKGHIDLSEVTKVTEGNSTTPGAPKKSEDKCFFELHTVKRHYCFCADDRQAAHEWVSKIQMCLQ